MLGPREGLGVVHAPVHFVHRAIQIINELYPNVRNSCLSTCGRGGSHSTETHSRGPEECWFKSSFSHAKHTAQYPQARRTDAVDDKSQLQIPSCLCPQQHSVLTCCDGRYSVKGIRYFTMPCLLTQKSRSQTKFGNKETAS